MTTEEAMNAIKAVAVTQDTIVFVNMHEINCSGLSEWVAEAFPFTVMVVGVVGDPHVESMSLERLKEIVARLEEATLRG